VQKRKLSGEKGGQEAQEREAERESGTEEHFTTCIPTAVDDLQSLQLFESRLSNTMLPHITICHGTAFGLCKALLILSLHAFLADIAASALLIFTVCLDPGLSVESSARRFASSPKSSMLSGSGAS